MPLLAFFKSFVSKINPMVPQNWVTPIRLLVDATTGTPYGIQNPRANAPDGIWGLRDVTTDQVITPSAAMLADLDATYRLNVEPYTRYRSNGDAIIPIDGEGGVVIPAGTVQLYYSPLEIIDPEVLIVEGTLYVRDLAA